MFDAVVAIKDAVELSKKDNGKVDFPGDLPFFVAPIPKMITGFAGANNIPKELSDLDPQELTRLRDRFGDIVDDERFQRAFYGLAIAGDAIYEIISDTPQDGQLPQPEQPAKKA